MIASDLPKVAILGDLLIDETWFVQTPKLSPEAPVPIARILEKEPLISPGGAGLAATYAIKKNIPSILVSCVSEEYKDLLLSKKIKVENLGQTENVKKIRYLDVESNYHLIRVDTDEITNTSIQTKNIIPKLEHLILRENIPVVAFLDYRKGLFRDRSLVKKIIKLCEDKRVSTYVDSRGSISKFVGIDVIKINLKEFYNLQKEINEDPQEILKQTEAKMLIVTKGKEGATLYRKDEKSLTCKVKKVSGIADVTGCGDVFDINFCYYNFIKKYSPEDSLKLSVDAASLYAYTTMNEKLC
jgi:D-beta-D-heptose 7-phosphate kinase/D-beta-D-heptose 1-phosphate adenosyltransferase